MSNSDDISSIEAAMRRESSERTFARGYESTMRKIARDVDDANMSAIMFSLARNPDKGGGFEGCSMMEVQFGSIEIVLTMIALGCHMKTRSMKIGANHQRAEAFTSMMARIMEAASRGVSDVDMITLLRVFLEEDDVHTVAKLYSHMQGGWEGNAE